jgi:hypothetical protein
MKESTAKRYCKLLPSTKSDYLTALIVKCEANGAAECKSSPLSDENGQIM